MAYDDPRPTLVFKRCPELSPDHVTSWIGDVRTAFEERGWSQYLQHPPLPIATATATSPNATPFATPGATPAATPESTDETETPAPPAITVSTAPTITLSDTIARRAKAFLLTGIQYEHRYGLEEYGTASEILYAIQTRYGTTAEDALRLEEAVMSLKKPLDQSIDEHINTFSALISKILAA